MDCVEEALHRAGMSAFGHDDWKRAIITQGNCRRRESMECTELVSASTAKTSFHDTCPDLIPSLFQESFFRSSSTSRLTPYHSQVDYFVVQSKAKVNAYREMESDRESGVMKSAKRDRPPSDLPAPTAAHRPATETRHVYTGARRICIDDGSAS